MRPPDPRQLQLQFESVDADGETPPAASARATPKTLRLPLPEERAPSASTDAGKPGLPGTLRSLNLGLRNVEYLLRRSKRRTVGFLIDDHGLHVTAPRWLTIAAIEDALRDKQRWILTRLDQRRERLARPPAPPVRWSDGTVLPYLGRDITLRLALGADGTARLDQAASELVLTVPDHTSEPQVREHVRKWMQQEALRIFTERVPLYESRLGVACRSFALTSAGGRWGSCSPGGRIRLNWRLIHFPLALIDYVIAHELAHLREMNHGPRFWAAVASAFPDHASAKAALREQAPLVMSLL